MTSFISTTISSVLEETTQDDDPHDDDQAIPESERKDEINDSKQDAKISSTNKKSLLQAQLKCLFLYIFIIIATQAVLGVNICLIFFGWILVIASVLLVYATFKRQSKLVLPYIFALLEAVLLVILLEVLPEFIDNLGVGWFLLLNFLIGEKINKSLKLASIINKSIFYHLHSRHCLHLDRCLLALLRNPRRRTEPAEL